MNPPLLQPMLRQAPGNGHADQAAIAGAGAGNDGREGGGGDASCAAPGRAPMHSDAGNFGPKRLPAASFTIWEVELAEKLGVDRRRLVELRESSLREGQHFVKKGRRLLYNEAGATFLAVRLGIDGRDVKNALTDALKDAPAAPAKFVIRRICANPYVLECSDAAGELAMVRVHPCQNFIRGMEVRAIPYGRRKGIFEFVGPYPRFRGKY